MLSIRQDVLKVACSSLHEPAHWPEGALSIHSAGHGHLLCQNPVRFLHHSTHVWGICPLCDFVFTCPVLSSKSLLQNVLTLPGQTVKEKENLSTFRSGEMGCGDRLSHETKGSGRVGPSSAGSPGGGSFLA